MRRRNFIKALPLLPIAGIAGLTKTQPKPLPEVRSGDIVTAETFNNIIRRVNDLERNDVP